MSPSFMPEFRKECLPWTALAGSAMALGLLSPMENYPWLACVLFVPLVWFLDHDPSPGIFKGMLAGWIFGSLSWGAGTWWILTAAGSLLDLAPWPSRGASLLVWLYQGTPFALAGMACGWMARKGSPAGPLFGASILTLLIFARPVLFPVTSAVAVALWPRFIQVAGLGGEYLVLFSLILANWLAADLISGVTRRNGRAILKAGISMAILLVLVLGYGSRQLFRFHEKNTGQQVLSVASVQPNVPVSWERAEDIKSEETLCLQALETHLDLVRDAGLLIFPELPRFNCRSGEFINSGLAARLRGLGIPVLMQSDEDIFAAEPPTVTETNRGKRSIVTRRIEKRFSSVFSLLPGEPCSRVYRKMHPVPFSEVPLKRLIFPDMESEPGKAPGFSRGETPGLLHIGALGVQPLICFESGFPNIIRQGLPMGTSLLVELSNDAWFASRDAEMKHLGMAIFRTAEFRRPLVRCSNSGSGAHIRATGEIAQGTLTPHNNAWATRDTLFCPRDISPFARWGNTWLWLPAFIVFWHLGHMALRRPGV